MNFHSISTVIVPGSLLRVVHFDCRDIGVFLMADSQRLHKIAFTPWKLDHYECSLSGRPHTDGPITSFDNETKDETLRENYFLRVASSSQTSPSDIFSTRLHYLDYEIDRWLRGTGCAQILTNDFLGNSCKNNQGP